MGGRRLVRRLTIKELAQRITKEKTENIALQCLRCREIYEIESGFTDGFRCSLCGTNCKPLGFLATTKTHKNHIQHEASEQEKLFRWASYMCGKYPELRLLHHIPNGGSRNKIEAANLKKQGVRAGVPDICLPIPRANFHGLYIELKAGKNKATEKQRDWLYALQEQGYVAVVCVGCEQAIEVITKYLQIGGKENE